MKNREIARCAAKIPRALESKGTSPWTGVPYLIRLRLARCGSKAEESDGGNMDVTVAYPAPPAGDATLFRVDDLIVDLGRCRVIRAGVDLKVSGLSFDLFVALMRAAPNVVTVRATDGYRMDGTQSSAPRLSANVSNS